MQPRLTLTGDVNPVNGYGHHLMRLFHGLRSVGVFVSIRALKAWEAFGATIPVEVRAHIVNTRQPEEWELLLAQPYNSPTPERRTLFYTMWESTELPGDFVKHINLADGVIVPSAWNKRVFEDNGVVRPIFVVPLGIDPEIFRPSPMNESGPCIFATAGRILHGGSRKGVNEVIGVFQAAFPTETDVELRVKVQPDDPVMDTDDPRIKIEKAHWSDQEIAGWLQECTAFVSGAAGEGWGFWQHQASGCARPVIAAIYGGLREFMSPESSYPVAYTEENASGFPGKWAAPDWVAMMSQMRRVYMDRAEAAEKGKLAAQRAHRYTWQYSLDRLIAVLNATGAITTPGEHVLHAPTPCRTQFPPPYRPPVLAQVRDHGWEGGYIAFPPGDRLHFNPGLVDYHGKRLLFARQAIFSNGHRVDNRVVCYELDRWRAHHPKVIFPHPKMPDREYEDPRCFVDSHGRVQMSFTSLVGDYAQQYFASLDHNMEPESIWRIPYGRNSGAGHEKSWLWFRDEGLRFIYEVVPHTVVAVDNGVAKDQWITYPQNLKWQHGRPRGGTPPVLVDDVWYSFFHSCVPWKQKRLQYYMGAYAFENKPPYRITAMSRTPLLAGTPNDPSMGEAHSVIYPTGAIMENGKWLIVAGENDEGCIWMEIPHDTILRSMQSV